MQAPLSSTASGKLFRTGSLTAVLPARPTSTPDRKKRSSRLIGGASLLYTPPLDSVAEGKGLAHDAGNLLGALGLYCELLALPGVLREEHRHYAEELQQLSGRSRELIDRLLNPATTGRRAARLDQKDDSDRMRVPDVIEGCRSMLNAVARRAVVVAYEAGASLPIAVPRESLERILVNLTKNAAEAMKDAPEIEGMGIKLRVGPQRDAVTGEHIVLTVEDRGCGMSTAAVKVLFSETRAARGIGFQVVRELVGTSGGELRLTSAVGNGTTVSIAWPVMDEAKDEGVACKAADSPRHVLEERLTTIARKDSSMRRSSC